MTSPQTRGFLFADLRGYTRYAEQHGDAAAAELLRRYRMAVREVVARHDGAEIRTEGDSFYVVFGSVSVAVRAGLAILEATATASDESMPIRPGIGINAGETADSDEGIVSTAVNVAARLCSIAGPGELLVTDTVRALTRTYLDVRFLPRGTKRLKNIAEPVEIFRVATAAAADALMPTPWVAPLTRWRRERWSRGTALAVGLAALASTVAVGAAVMSLDRAGSISRTPPGAIDSIAPAASASETAVSLTADEQALVERLPAEVAATCRPAASADGALDRSVASLVCPLPFGSEADVVWYDQITTAAQAQVEFEAWPGLDEVPAGECDPDIGNAKGPWEVGVLSGMLACYQLAEPSESWVVWTYQEPPVLARAVRRDLGWQELFEWWRLIGPYLRVTPGP